MIPPYLELSSPEYPATRGFVGAGLFEISATLTLLWKLPPERIFVILVSLGYFIVGFYVGLESSEAGETRPAFWLLSM